jgi:hypothetical protein
MSKPQAKKKPNSNNRTRRFAVVGVAHRITMSTRKLIAAKIKAEDGLGCVLFRERDNPADENAIKVILEDAPYNELHIGYLPRQVAAVIAPKWDSGKVEIKRVVLVDMTPHEGEGEVKVTFSVRKKTA